MIYGCVKGDFVDETTQGCDKNLLVLNDVLDKHAIIGYKMSDLMFTSQGQGSP